MIGQGARAPVLPAAAATPRARRRRPDPQRQCKGVARTTGRRCGRPTANDSLHCHAHAPAKTTTTALTAAVASVQLDTAAFQSWRPGAGSWQNEAWRLYDITGQLRFVSNWVGNSVSRCRLYVAEVDDSGEPGNETEDPEIAALAAGPLGQGPAKDEALRLLGINLFVPGEAYIVAEADADENGDDRWFVVSGRQIRRAGDTVIIRRSMLHGGGDMTFRPGTDIILRVWTPHPADTDEADSPTRSAIPDLREIEAIRKREYAELDSRLSGAGLLPLPDGVEFPHGDDEPADMQSFQRMLMRTMATSLQDQSSAAAMVPIMFRVPGEYLDKIKQVTFWSSLSAELLPMRTAAVTSLAQSLDVPAEILLGQADSNHWTAWQVGEDAITTQIVPVLSRIADALTTGWLQGALEELGADPDRYVYAFDTSPLTVRPNRAADALNYHGAGLLSDEAAVEAGAFRADQMPSQVERLRRLAETLVVANPALLADPTIRDLIGIVGPIVVPAQAPAPVDEEAPPEGDEPRALPQETPQTEDEASSALTAVAGLAVRRALSLAGGRLVPHSQRDRWPDCPRYQLHARNGPIGHDKADQVLRGAWDDLPAAADDLHLDPHQLQRLLHGFTCELLTRGMAYDPRLLRDLVTAAMRGRRLEALAAVA
jgi:hypothetical protein